jgi:hypothetical protein
MTCICECESIRIEILTQPSYEEGEACSFPVMAGRKGKWESINAMLASLDLKIGTNNYGWVGVEFFNN